MIKRGLKRPKEPEASRQSFLDSAYGLFCEKGYAEVSVDEVIQRAGRSKGGFYHHFKSKSDLFQEMFEDLFKRYTEPMERDLRGGIDLRDAMGNHLARFSGVLRDTRQLRAMYELYVLAMRDREVRKVARKLNAAGTALVRRFLEHSTRQGRIKPLGKRLDGTAELLFHASRGVVMMELALNDGRDIAGKVNRFMEHELEGFGRAPGAAPKRKLKVKAKD